MTSLDMRGVQLSVLRLFADNWEVLDWIDAPTSAPYWPKSLVGEESFLRTTPAKLADDQYRSTVEYSVRNDPYRRSLNIFLKNPCDPQNRGPSLSDEDQLVLSTAIHAAAGSLENNTGCLNNLDSGCGDGDCGTSMSRWIEGMILDTHCCSIVSNLAHCSVFVRTELHLSHPYTLLQQLSDLTEANIGGTTGALYSIMFAAASQAFLNEEEQVTWRNWLQAGQLGLAAIMKYGGAGLGDRSMVTSLSHIT